MGFFVSAFLFASSSFAFSIEQSSPTVSNILARSIVLEGNLTSSAASLDMQVLRHKVQQLALEYKGEYALPGLYSLADKLTDFYAQRGLKFHRVYIEKSGITQEQLSVRVVGGWLGKVNILGESSYKADIQAVFSSLLDQAIYERDINTAVSRVKRFPGIEVFAFYSVGAGPGEIHLNIRVLKENLHSTWLYADSLGAEETGRMRLGGGYAANNLFHAGGRLQVWGMLNSEPGNSYGEASYRKPFLDSHFLAVSAGRSQFFLAKKLRKLNVEGSLDSVRLNWFGSTGKHGLWPSTYEVGVAANKYELTSDAAFSSFLGEQLNYAKVQLAAHYLWAAERWLQQLSVSPSFIRIDKLGRLALADQALVKMNYSLRYNWSVESNLQSNVTLRTLYSAKPIPQAEYLSLTGGASVRGFESGLLTFDQAASLQTEHYFWRREHQWLGQYRLFALADFSYGEHSGSQRQGQFGSLGLGVKVNKQKFSFGSYVAFPVYGEDEQGRDYSDSGARFDAKLRWSF